MEQFLDQMFFFIRENDLLKMLLDGYFVWIIVFFILNFVLKNKKIISIFLSVTLIYFLYVISKTMGLTVSNAIFAYALSWGPLALIIILAPDIRKSLESIWRADPKRDVSVSSSDYTKKSIVDAVFYLADRKIGALITIEKHNSLDQYAEKAVNLNSDVSTELLINIFSPLTPLHDGAVIIRGDKIRCAASYFVLTETSNVDKTLGSRHRAALGISEISDSLTVVVSEETGNISITIEGIMLKVGDKEKLLEYIDMFMK